MLTIDQRQPVGKWMYNPATQIQVPTDADLGSYYFKKL
jgi:hypothetical protein